MSVNKIFLLAFTALLLIVVAVLSVTQYNLFAATYAHQIREEEVAVSKEIYLVLKNIDGSGNPASSALANSYIRDKNEKTVYSVSLVNENGKLVYPYAFEEEDSSERDFSDRIDKIKEKFRRTTNGKSGTAIVYREGNAYYAVTITDLKGGRFYLIVSTPMTFDETLRGVMILQIVLACISVIGLAAIAIGMLSARISTPLTEISRNARLLGKGNFDVKFDSGDGFCKEINELSQSLEETKEEISKSDRMQKELIANVSHDFKTPLTMIKAYASMIQDFSGEDPEKRNKHCQVIIDESDRLASLVGDLLDVSKISAGIVVLKESIFNLSEYALTIVDRFRYLEESKGYRFDVDITPNLFTEADKDKIGQVLYNLIGNAVNYTGEDKRIKIRLMQDRNCIRFDVTDTGKGIKKEELDTIWDRYYRSSETHKRPVQGTGLGLSIVKAILTRHEFSFGVKSEYGKGSCFYVEFPVRTACSIEEPSAEE